MQSFPDTRKSLKKGGCRLQYTNVKLISNANVYFDGKVSSRTFYEQDGTRKTLGFVSSGEYEFSTDGAEYMEILQGVFEIRLPGEDTFTAYHAGDTFTIPKHTKFPVRTDSFSDYCCTYLSD